MADNLNHNVVDVHFEIMNATLQQKNEALNYDYTSFQKNIINYSTLFEHRRWTKDDINNKDHNIISKFNYELFVNNLKALSPENHL